MEHSIEDGTHVIALEGRIDSNNAVDVERSVFAVLEGDPAPHVRLDVSQLTYISSAGLRILMRLVKSCASLSVEEVTPEVYEVFDMTGITEIVPVHKKLREVSLEGLRQIGAGAFGRVYRLDDERVIKVYNPAVNPLAKIERERQSARQAFIHDIPSAIPFDLVRVGQEYGIVYELIDALTLGEAVVASPDRLDEYGLRMAQLLRKLHSTHFDEGMLPDARQIFHTWVDIAARGDLYAAETISRLRQFVEDIPEGDTFVHGDFHPANIMVMPDGELLLIDMGDASMGDPRIDLAGTYHVVRVAGSRPGGAMRFCGMPQDMLERLWDVFARAYFDVTDDVQLEEIERKLAFFALPRTMGSTARSKLLTEEVRRHQARELEQAFLAGIDSMA